MKLSLVVSLVLLLVISFALAETTLEKAESQLETYQNILRSASEHGYKGSKKTQRGEYVNRIKEKISKVEQRIRDLKAQSLADVAQVLYDEQAIDGRLLHRVNIFLKKYKQYRDRGVVSA